MVALSTLAVEGALLAYTCSGSGSILLAIPGANGDAGIFDQVVPYLAQNFTVCTYDRRGYSNSTITAPANLSMPYRLQRDADDAALLIKHISPSSPALVFSTSSGAIVGLELLQRHPDTIEMIIAHEPPLSYSLGDAEGGEVEAVFTSIYDTYLAEGVDAAAYQFVGNDTTNVETAAAWSALTDPDRLGNSELFFGHEIATYTAVNESLSALGVLKNKLVFDIGVECGIPSCNMSTALAEAIGVDLYETPGGHLGYVSEAKDFSEALSSIFAEKGKM